MASFLHQLAGKLDKDGGPPVEEFMARDASFLQNLDMHEEAGDTIEYHLYTDRPDKGVETLRRLEKEVMGIIEELTRGYIWHVDPFQLRVHKPQKDDDEPHLMGRTRVGENIDDEWFITYLLFQLTERLEQSWGLTVETTDLDGEFLLIEAAYAIPSWVGPENSRHRLWIRGGKTHFLQLHHCAAQPTPKAALTLLRSATSTTLAPSIQDALTPRLNQYPDKAKREHHRCTCLLPVSVAHLLHHQPQLIAPAIRTLAHRRDRDRHGQPPSLTRLTMFNPEHRPDNEGQGSTGKSGMVHRRVVMTRWLYSLLSDETFHPPKSWVPATKAWGIKTTDKASQLGAKVTYGFELLYQESKAGQGQGQSDPHRNKLWKQYLKRLEKVDFFQGTTPGSRAYREKMEIARQRFMEGQGGGASMEGQETAAPHSVMDGILAKEPMVVVDEGTSTPDDDEGWMEVAPGDLDSLLAKYGRAEGQEEEEEEEMEGPWGGQGDEELARMVRGMREFMGGMAGLEGAEVPGDGVKLNVDRLLSVLGGREVDDFDSSSDLEESEEEEEEEDEGRVFESGPAEGDVRKASVSTGGSRGGVGVSAGATVREPAMEEERRGAAFEGVTVREVLGADSDDEVEEEEEEEETQMPEEGFLASYMEALDQQLRGTTLGESFERAPAAAPVPPKPKGGSRAVEEEEEEEEEEELRPVDVNMNLVMSLLESYSRQEGQPGPVSNLLGEMATRLGGTQQEGGAPAP